MVNWKNPYLFAELFIRPNHVLFRPNSIRGIHMLLFWIDNLCRLHVWYWDYLSFIDGLILKKTIAIFLIFQLHPLDSVGPVVINNWKASNSVINRKPYEPVPDIWNCLIWHYWSLDVVVRRATAFSAPGSRRSFANNWDYWLGFSIKKEELGVVCHRFGKWAGKTTTCHHLQVHLIY